ncbi:MAG: GntR family transcriptional regulator [Alkaliphilus sp.]|nr:GntR family transcriptional regulator [Alkaliphilus sp. AH-315-G20]MBN4067687.1 GntR family transcriptional regulator [Alkaliphilus transvaalensis]MBN4069666.1 GntR family transcriptional regulator [bacterium AH-315-G05]PHS34244.1 MAG: GntR family transcriptional regulator [Alkaliphilus sp.]
MNIVISNATSEPIYFQIATQIKREIMRGELSSAEMLPSIRSLAKELRISVITTKRAYEELEREGFIETVPGKGSYVATQSNELLNEKKKKIIEDKIEIIVEESKLLGIELEELIEMLKLIYIFSLLWW